MTLRNIATSFSLFAALTLGAAAFVGCQKHETAADKIDNAKNDVKDAAHDVKNDVKDAAH